MLSGSVVASESWAVADMLSQQISTMDNTCFNVLNMFVVKILMLI